MKITPLGNRCLIEIMEDEKEKKTLGGLFIPESVGVKQAPQKGLVIAVGKDCESEVKVGDSILFEKFAGADVEDDNKKFKLIAEDDLIATFEG